jgi:Fe(3+) dicitrate transport protein
MYYGDPGGYYMTPLQQIEKVEVIRGGSLYCMVGTRAGEVKAGTNKSKDLSSNL